MNRAIPSLSIATAVALFAGTAEAATPSGFSYHYFKESRPLTLDTTRVAVFSTGDDAGRAAAMWVVGLSAESEIQIPIHGLTLIDLDVTSRDALSIQATVAAAAARADTTGFVSPVFVGEDGGPIIVTHDLLIGFADSTTPQQARAIAASVGAVLDEEYAQTPGLYRVRANARDGFEVLDAANRIAELPQVSYAEPDMIFTGHSASVPNDPDFPNAWALQNTAQFGGIAGQDMNALKAWEITTGSNSIITLVIDTGVDPTHPDLNLLVPGSDATGGAGQGAPDNACDNHGTAVAGCISGKINNALGGVGIAPTTRVASVRTFISGLACDGSWSSQASWTVGALSFAAFSGARVTNNSNLYGFTSSTISNKYNSTKAAGVVHFASAGNNGSSSIGYPSSIASVNSIAALDVNGSRAGFSQFGSGLDFSAPGVNIHTTDRQGSAGWTGDDYVYATGTSFASPLSAGVAALLLSYKPALTPAQVERAMQQGSRDRGTPGYDTGYGWGFVDAYRSLERVRCPADLSFDDAVDDSDFIFFVTSYNLLICTDPAMPLACSADLNNDGFVDDADFVIFVPAYNTLLCP